MKKYRYSRKEISRWLDTGIYTGEEVKQMLKATLPQEDNYTVCDLCGRKTGHSKDCPIMAKEMPSPSLNGLGEIEPKIHSPADTGLIYIGDCIKYVGKLIINHLKSL